MFEHAQKQLRRLLFPLFLTFALQGASQHLIQENIDLVGHGCGQSRLSKAEVLPKPALFVRCPWNALSFRRPAILNFCPSPASSGFGLWTGTRILISLPSSNNLESVSQELFSTFHSSTKSEIFKMPPGLLRSNSCVDIDFTLRRKFRKTGFRYDQVMNGNEYSMLI